MASHISCQKSRGVETKRRSLLNPREGMTIQTHQQCPHIHRAQRL
ncbi:hypothetical protein Gotri_007251, partial [Gossypium trilobum]|nr:hypothetical protein [Gossypium trilobum]